MSFSIDPKMVATSSNQIDFSSVSDIQPVPLDIAQDELERSILMECQQHFAEELLDDNLVSLTVQKTKEQPIEDNSLYINNQMFISQILKVFSDSPSLRLEIGKQFEIPEYENGQIKIQALKDLTKHLEERIKSLEQSVSEITQLLTKEKNSEKIYELSNETESLQVEINQCQAKILSNKQEIESLEDSQKILMAETASLCGLVIKFEKEESTQKQQDLFVKIIDKFNEARKNRPLNLLPYYPFFSLFSKYLDKALLKSILQDAKNVNAGVTYSYIMTFITVLNSLKHKELFKERNLHMLDVLKDLYPKDVVIEGLIKSIDTSTDAISLSMDRFSKTLTLAINALEKNDIDLSIKILSYAKECYPGYKIIYQYLSVALAIKGKVNKAFDYLNATSVLMDFDGKNLFFNKSILNSIIKFKALFLSKDLKIESFTIDKEPDPLSCFLKLVRNYNSKNCFTDAVSFFKEACKYIDEAYSHQFLPLLYFCIQWIAKNPIKIANDDEQKEFFVNLFNFYSQIVNLGFLNGLKDDEWFKDHYIEKKRAESVSYILKNLAFEFGKPEKEFDKLEINGLELNMASTKSLLLRFCQMLHEMVCGYMALNKVGDIDFNEMHLSSLSQKYLFMTRGFQSKFEKNINNFAYKNAKGILKDLLTQPKTINPIIIDFGRFAISTFEYEKDISTYSYPLTPAHEKEFIGVLNSHNLSQHDSLMLPLRNSFLALERIQNRDQFVMPLNFGNGYELVTSATQYFGWRLGETFDEWGRRLQTFHDDPLIASEIDLFEHRIREYEGPIIDAELRGFLRSYLSVIQKIQQSITCKNQMINEGGDESKDSKSLNRQWGQDFMGTTNEKMDQWIRFIDSNKTASSYPGYRSLSDSLKKELNDVIQDKRGHCRELSKLLEFRNKCPSKNQTHFYVYQAALLLVAANYSRNVVSHSVSAFDQNSAEMIYRILFEVMIDQIIREKMIQIGPYAFSVGGFIQNFNPECIFEVMQGDLFHGPERHVFGVGPHQQHYNAKILVKDNIVNTHIYF